LPKKNDLERKALQLVFDAGHEGLLQSDMWKELGLTSREGSKMGIKFEKKGVVNRRKVLHNGRWTYRLFSLRKPITIDSIKDCPCIICEELDKCFDGGQVSPINCQPLTLWMESSTTIPDD
jgi:hypothetical protein